MIPRIRKNIFTTPLINPRTPLILEPSVVLISPEGTLACPPLRIMRSWFFMCILYLSSIDVSSLMSSSISFASFLFSSRRFGWARMLVSFSVMTALFALDVISHSITVAARVTSSVLAAPPTRSASIFCVILDFLSAGSVVVSMSS